MIFLTINVEIGYINPTNNNKPEGRPLLPLVSTCVSGLHSARGVNEGQLAVSSTLGLSSGRFNHLCSLWVFLNTIMEARFFLFSLERAAV